MKDREEADSGRSEACFGNEIQHNVALKSLQQQSCSSSKATHCLSLLACLMRAATLRKFEGRFISTLSSMGFQCYTSCCISFPKHASDLPLSASSLSFTLLVAFCTVDGQMGDQLLWSQLSISSISLSTKVTIEVTF